MIAPSALLLRRFAALALLVPVLTATGCASTGARRSADWAKRLPYGYTFFVDGAGSGGALTNWSRGVKTGLLAAGYRGSGEQLVWQTKPGVTAAQISSQAYKREKGIELADKIREYQENYPGAPVHLIGMSAGTAVTLFALEALPASSRVDSVVLLGSSVSSTYDLTPALRRVRDRMYVFTSAGDAVLRFLVPIAGTADRVRTGRLTAGINGFQLPSFARGDQRDQYGKLVQIQYAQAFAAAGNKGDHTGAVKPDFVQSYVAPLIMANARPARNAQPGSLPNPDFDRWAKFDPGAFVVLEGDQSLGGERQPVRVTARLVMKNTDMIYVERVFEHRGSYRTQAPRVRGFFQQRFIRDTQHPRLAKESTWTQLPEEVLTIARRPIKCQGFSGSARGDFVAWGTNPSATVWYSPHLPGEIARIQLRTMANGQPLEFVGEIVGFGFGSP